jgi:hypothetical protein
MSDHKDYPGHSERSEESLLKPPRFFTPRRFVQNDMNIHKFVDYNLMVHGKKVSSPVMLRTLAREGALVKAILGPLCV